MNLYRIVMDQKAACRHVEIGGSDTMTHVHEGLSNLIVDWADFEHEIFYPQHIMNIAFQDKTSIWKEFFEHFPDKLIADA